VRGDISSCLPADPMVAWASKSPQLPTPALPPHLPAGILSP